MDDVIALYISPEHVREWTVVSCFIAALFIGPYLAFAATPDASFKCLQAFVRLVHRVFLCALSIALLNLALVVGSGNEADGAGMAVYFTILVTVICSAVRYHWWMADIPNGASWRNPQFTRRDRGGAGRSTC